MNDNRKQPITEKAANKRAKKCDVCGDQPEAIAYANRNYTVAPYSSIECVNDDCDVVGAFGDNLLEALNNWNKGDVEKY